MNEPIRTQWEIRCAFNAYCKRALMNENLVAYRDMKRRQLREVGFSDLTQQEEDQLCTYDTYFANDEAVLLYYFFDMNDAEIAKLQNIPRSTVQYRRTSSFDLLKRYLEEHTYGKDW